MRQEILRLLRRKAESGEPIVGVGVGTRASAEQERAAGADLLIIYHPGHFGLAGAGSMLGYLAFGNANQAVKEMAPEIIPAAGGTPVLAGVCGTDPFLLRELFLEELQDSGFAGIQNFPTVGLIDGRFRKNLEETGMSYGREVECIATAHALGLLTAPVVFDRDQALAMIEAGADLLVAHPGLGPVQADSSDKLVAVAAAAQSTRADILVLRHVGAATAAAAARQRLFPGIAGVFAISPGERRSHQSGVGADREAVGVPKEGYERHADAIDPPPRAPRNGAR